jgi:uncharacterized membrane protein (GlpM family)
MDPFTIRVILAFMIGGLYVATLIWISEKYGSKIGGILTGIPTTVFIGLTFIAITAGDMAAHKAALIIPAMVGVSLVLVYSFTQLLKFGIEKALAIAIVIWAVVTFCVVNLHVSSLAINIAIGVSLMAIAKVAMKHYPHDLVGSTKVLRRTYLVRVVAAGSVIAGAVVVARVAGPIWGGVFATFPATFVTTLYILSKAQGPEFVKAVARQLPLANGSTLSFAVIFYLLIIPAGLKVSVLAAIAGSLIYTFLLMRISSRKI